ncbi:MAG: hypothetical protein ACRCT8_12500 [Lacipirellulaceae bacterium]
MTERERWIVYPLLFLALGAALRDKMAKQTRAQQLVCEQLLVVDSKGRVMTQLAGDKLLLGVAGPSHGYVQANTIDAQTLVQLGQRIDAAAQQSVSWNQLLGLMQRMGLMRVVPGAAGGQDPALNADPKAPPAPAPTKPALPNAT